ncbi:MAG: methanol dehydrogenase [Gammaproteobacteria bacterium]|jgi:hypothetical protein|nr:methanol dehydrogenase [Gammaproteobacteria bacterium]
MRARFNPASGAIGAFWSVVLLVVSSGPMAQEHAEWPAPAGDFANTRFSALQDITTSNVSRLKRSFTFSTGLLRGHEAAPIVTNDTPNSGVFPASHRSRRMAPGGTIEVLSRDAIRLCSAGAYRRAMWDAAVVLSAERRLTNTTCSRGAVFQFLPFSYAHSHSRARLSVLAPGRLMWLLVTGC